MFSVHNQRCKKINSIYISSNNHLFLSTTHFINAWTLIENISKYKSIFVCKKTPKLTLPQNNAFSKFNVPSFYL